MSPSKLLPRRSRTLHADQHTPGQFRPETVPTATRQRLLTAKICEYGIARQMRRNDAERAQR